MVYQEFRELVLPLWWLFLQNTFWNDSLQIYSINWSEVAAVPRTAQSLWTPHQSTGQEKHLGYQGLCSVLPWAACPPLQHWAQTAEPAQLLRCQLQLSSTQRCNTQLLQCSMAGKQQPVSRKDSITCTATTKSASTNCFPIKGQKLFVTGATMLNCDSEFQTRPSHKHSHLRCAILFQYSIHQAKN